MLDILSITAPIFILIGLGYVSVMTGLITRETTRGMGIFVITIALPAMIVRGMANKPLKTSLDLNFLLGYAVASLLVLIAGMLAMAAAPVALFAVGGNLHGLRPSGMLADAGRISAGKLILHPTLTALVFLLIPGLDTNLRKAGVLFAASPMMSMYPIIGMRYGLEDRSSTALLMATIGSFVTISIAIALIR